MLHHANGAWTEAMFLRVGYPAWPALHDDVSRKERFAEPKCLVFVLENFADTLEALSCRANTLNAFFRRLVPA